MKGKEGEGRGIMVPYEEHIPENAKTIAEHTFQVYERLWFENFSKNVPKIRNGRNLRELIEGNIILRSPYCLVIGAGPSIEKYKQLDVISKSNFDGLIIVCDKILKECLKHKIVPHIVVSADATEKVADFFSGIQSSIKEIKSITTYPIFLLHIFIHPKTLENIEKITHWIFWFITSIDDPVEEKSMTRALYWMSGEKMIIPGLGNVGALCWNIGGLLGCKKIGLVGIDFGYPANTRLEDTAYYNAYKTLGNMNNQPIEKFYRTVKNPLGNEVLTCVNWDVYNYIFTTFIEKAYEKFGIETFNLSPISCVSSEKIKFVDLEKFLNKEV